MTTRILEMATTPGSARRTAMTVAAAHLLIEHGPAAITHRRVAEAAGIPAGSANAIFRSRDELYAAAVSAAEGIRNEAGAKFARELSPQSRNSLDTAGLLLATWYAPHLDRNLVKARLEPMLSASTDPALQTIMRASRPHLLANLETVLRRSGHAAFTDVELLAQVIDGSLLYAASLGEPDPRDAAAKAIARLLNLAPEGASDSL